MSVEGGLTRRISWSLPPPPSPYSTEYSLPPPSFSTSRTIFAVASRIFTVEQFEIQRWKANEHTNLRKSKESKIRALQPEKSRNIFEQVQITGFSSSQLSFSSQFIFVRPCSNYNLATMAQIEFNSTLHPTVQGCKQLCNLHNCVHKQGIEKIYWLQCIQMYTEILTTRICSLFLHRNAKLAFLFFCVPRSCTKFGFPRAHAPKMPGTLKCGNTKPGTRKTRNVPPSLTRIVQFWKLM